MIIENIYKFIDFKRITAYEISKKLGISNGYLAKTRQNKGSVGGNILEKIVSYYPEINPTWLLTGKGSMLLDNNNNNVVSGSVVSEPEAVYKTTPVREKEPPQAAVLHPEIQYLKERIKDKEEIINLYKASLKDKEETIISQKEKLKENEEKIRQADTLIYQLKKHLAELQEKWAELNKRLPKEKKYNPSGMDVGNKLPVEPPANQSGIIPPEKLQEDKRKRLRK